MSINPVQNIEPATSFASHNSPGAQSPTPAPARKVQADSGTLPDPEPGESQNVPSLSEVPKDEVEVQRDSQNNGEIVVRYVDHSGNLILQMPTEQVLNMTRAIDEDLERELQAPAKVQETKVQETVEGHEGGKSDGH
jgi:S-adenosylmethionine hydrolase